MEATTTATKERRSQQANGLTPYCTVGQATLYQGDVLRIAPALTAGTAAAVITDPPYSSGGLGAATRAADPKEKYCHGGNDGVGIHPARFIHLPLWNEVIWHRAGAINFNCQKFPSSHEGLWAFGRPHFWEKGADRNLSVWKINQVRNRADHPCPFPLELARRPILSSCPEGGVVLDPFSGSCTVGVACLQTGRRFIGFEKNARYLESAIERLKNWKNEAMPDVA